MNTIELSGEEASLLIEATTDALYQRVRWSIGHKGKWQSLPFDQVQMYLRALSTLHTKAWMVLRDIDADINQDYIDAFMIPEIVWDLIDEITSAVAWENVPKHLHSQTLCQICRLISRTASNSEI